MNTKAPDRGLASCAFLSAGLRPFFLAAALFAGIAVPLWTLVLLRGWQLPGMLGGRDWHIHEMLFGYFPAVLAGFILTAIPSWTGRAPLRGAPLGAALGLWLAARLALILAPWPLPAILLDLAFLLALLLFVLREITASRTWRHLPIAVLIAVLAGANILFHARGLGPELASLAERLALAVMALLISLIGGRIVPAFTRNWLKQQGIAGHPPEFSGFDKAVLLGTAAGLVLWILRPGDPLSGAALLALGLAQLLRLGRWYFWRTFREPLVTVLHLGYLWLALAFAFIGTAILDPALIAPSAAVHALTTGAVGTMTLAVMTRASRGHTGHALKADGLSLGIYLCITGAAVLRTGIGLLPWPYTTVLATSTGLWALAFILFLIVYGPMLLRPNAS